MTPRQRSGIAGAAVAVAVLCVPAAAGAHPSVYASTAPAGCTAPAAPYTAAQLLATCTTETRYVFTNHGNTYLLRESNGRTTGGAISYAHRPAGLAAASDFDIFAPAPQGATTGAQPHATCDVAALDSPAVIRSWQGTDPFYAYVPFQRTAVGVDDSAAAWLPVVRAATGVNLDEVADTDAARQTACQSVGGTYYPADATQSSLVSWSAGQVHLATAALEAQIADQAAQIGRLLASTSASAAAPDSATQVGALTSEIAALKLDLRSLKLSLPATLPSRGALAKDGIALTLAGPARRTVTVRALISAAKARRLGLGSRVLGTRRVVLGTDGNAAFTLNPSKAAATVLRKARGTLALAVDATTGDRHNLVSASLAA
jgi:hypothetical protein